MSETTHVLWTGGWDSTFRVLDLMVNSSSPSIQPHYIINPGRRSYLLEIETISKIREHAIKRWGERLLQPRTIEINQIPLTESARHYQNILARRFNIGPQYLWLAEYARIADIAQIELCIHVDDKAYRVINAKREELQDDEADAAAFFSKRFSFPILNLTKLEMLEKARTTGFEDLMNLTWFCQIPMPDGLPCGFCLPCQWTIDEGLAYRIPRSRRLRLAVYRGLASKLPSYRLRKTLLDLLRR